MCTYAYMFVYYVATNSSAYYQSRCSTFSHPTRRIYIYIYIYVYICTFSHPTCCVLAEQVCVGCQRVWCVLLNGVVCIWVVCICVVCIFMQHTLVVCILIQHTLHTGIVCIWVVCIWAVCIFMQRTPVVCIFMQHTLVVCILIQHTLPSARASSSTSVCVT